MGKSSTGGSQTTTSEPWAGVVPHLTGGQGTPGIYPAAAQLFGQYRNQFADENSFTRGGRKRQYDYANQLPGMLNPLNEAAQFGLTGATDVNNNPALQQAMQAATRPYEQQLALGTLPNIGREFTGAGQYGSSRQGVAEGVAEGLTNQGILDTRGRMASQAYGQGLDQQSRAMALMPQILQSGLMPSQLVGDVGRQMQAGQQRNLDEPYQRLQRYAGIIAPGAGMGGSVTQPGPNGPSGLQQGLGSAATLATIFALMSGGGGAAAGMINPASVGMSDARLKTNLEKIGEVNGINIYSWDWKSGGSGQGVIAQEVEQIWPDVVHEVDGFKVVDYAAIAGRI